MVKAVSMAKVKDGLSHPKVALVAVAPRVALRVAEVVVSEAVMAATGIVVAAEKVNHTEKWVWTRSFPL